MRNKTKDQLILIIEEQSANQKLLEERIHKLESSIKFSSRLIDIERRLTRQEQYSRRECVELDGINKKLDQHDLEKQVIELFNHAGVKVQQRDFHAIHRVGNNGVVICKVANRLQKRALRIITFSDNHAPSLLLFSNVNVLKLTDQVRLKNCMFVYNALNKSSPLCFHSYFTLATDIHQIYTRHASLGCIYISKQNTVKYGSNSITKKSIDDWNLFSKKVYLWPY